MELNDKQIQILKVAEKLFSENGFDGTSVRNIAKEANINVAMISYYFGSKEKLLGALLYYRTEDFKIRMASLLSEKGDFLTKLDDLIEFTVKRIHQNRRMYKIIHFEYSNFGRDIDFESYITQKKENFKIIESFVKQGQEAGAFSKDVNTALIFPTILGTYFHVFYNKRFFQELYFSGQDITFDDFAKTILTQHIQKTIKALLTYEI